MFEHKVTVSADPQGRVVIPTKNPEYAYIKLKQQIEEFDENGWLQIRTRTCLLKGKQNRLDQFCWKPDMKLYGRICVKESLTPFNEDDSEREIKMAGDSGVPCLYNDQPIYRKTFWDKTSTKLDELIQHTNVDEIRAVLLLQRKAQENTKPVFD